MAKKKARAPSARPIVPGLGDAFLMPLQDGRFGVCRVIRETTPDEEEGWRSGGMVLVAASSWIGTAAPDVSDPRLRKTLVLSHHSWVNQPEVNWVEGLPPRSFRRLGVIQPTPAEKRWECSVYAGWESFPLQVYLQWRWDHEREAVLREDERKKESEARERDQAAKRRQEYLAGLTLEGLKRKRRFAKWKGYVPDPLIAACRQIFRQTIDSLIELGPEPKKRTVLGRLRTCIERLNELDRENAHFIETVEREDLCEAFDEVVHAGGLRGYEDLADRWRDW